MACHALFVRSGFACRVCAGMPFVQGKSLFSQHDGNAFPHRIDHGARTATQTLKRRTQRFQLAAAAWAGKDFQKFFLYGHLFSPCYSEGMYAVFSACQAACRGITGRGHWRRIARVLRSLQAGRNQKRTAGKGFCVQRGELEKQRPAAGQDTRQGAAHLLRR